MLPGPRRLDDDIVNAIRSERFLERYQEIGVTTVRDVGARDWIGYSLKRTQRAGLMGGARYYTSGPIITVTGGHGSEFQPLHPPLWAVEASGPWAMRERVREAIKLEADLIKVAPFLTKEEMVAVVEEAHIYHLRVTAHIGGTHDLDKQFGRIAVEAGVDSTEHMYPYGGTDVINAMAEKGVYVIPTLGFHLRELKGEYAANAEKQSAEWLSANLGHTYETMMAQFREMREAGVRFAVGTDSNVKDLETIDLLYLQELQAPADGRHVQPGNHPGSNPARSTSHGPRRPTGKHRRRQARRPHPAQGRPPQRHQEPGLSPPCDPGRKDRLLLNQ